MMTTNMSKGYEKISEHKLYVNIMIYTCNYTLQLPDVFESSQNKCIEIHEPDPAYLFLGTPD